MKTAGPILAALILQAATAHAQEPASGLSIELNAASSQAEGCKLSFVVLNGHQADIAKSVFETVIFDAAGQVDRMTLFDFGALPTGRPRVRQFVVPGSDCADIGRILFNGAHACEGEGLADGACTNDLSLTTRIETEITG